MLLLRPATERVVLMRHIVLVVTAALVMAAMMVAMAMPAFANHGSRHGGGGSAAPEFGSGGVQSGISKSCPQDEEGFTTALGGSGGSAVGGTGQAGGGGGGCGGSSFDRP